MGAISVISNLIGRVANERKFSLSSFKVAGKSDTATANSPRNLQTKHNKPEIYLWRASPSYGASFTIAGDPRTFFEQIQGRIAISHLNSQLDHSSTA